MENEAKLQLTTKKKLGTCIAECSLNLSKDNDIKKILTLKSTPSIKSVTKEGSSCKVEGIVALDMLVVTDSDEIVPLKSECSFSQLLDASENCPHLFATSQLQEVSVRPQGTDFVITSEVLVDIYSVDDTQSVPMAIATEDVIVKEGEMQCMSHTALSTHDFTYSITIDRDSRVNRILFSSLTPCIKSVSPKTDSIVANIDLHLNLIYSTDDGSLRSMYKEYNLSQDISCEGVMEGSVLQSSVELGEVQLTESDETFLIDVPLTLKTHVYRMDTHKCILDAYSLDREVCLTTSSFETDEFLTTASIEDSLLTTFEAREDMPLIDKLLTSVPTSIKIVNTQVKDGEILLEGVASFNVIYFSEDEEGANILHSLDIDIPYSNTFAMKDVKEGDMVVTDLVIKEASIKSKHHKELEILSRLHATFNISRPTIQALTSSISFGEEKQETDYGMEIYLAKDGDTMWEVGKRLNIHLSDLAMQNPNVSLPLKSGDRLIAFHRKNS